MTRSRRNVGASVRARLLNHAREKNQPFELVLTRFVHERLLYRLSQTSHRQHFALKGALLLTTWLDDPHRPTRDLDLLGLRRADRDSVLAMFREIAGLTVDDGTQLDVDGLRVENIREELKYGGLRLRTRAAVDGARVHVVVDVGFGDAVEPGLQTIDLPVLLDMPAPRLRAYAPETVVAEKFETLVSRGVANTRLKDFYDLWVIFRTHEFTSDRLARAIEATFRRRETLVPTATPDAFTPLFTRDAAKRRQWEAFTRDVSMQPGPLEVVTADLEAFLMPWSRRAHVRVQGPLSPEGEVAARDPSDR